MGYQGDYRAADTIDFNFTTVSTGAVPTTLSGTPVVSVYKANSVTESTAGVTLTVDFDARTGMNHVRITTSSDTTFYADGNDYDVVITAGTVNSVSVVGVVIGSFSLSNRSALRPSIVGKNIAVDTSGYVTVTAFTPAQIPNCQMWLSASSAVYHDGGVTLCTNTQAVQQWNDLSGNGNHFQQLTGGSQPLWQSAGLNSVPSVRFNGSSNFMTVINGVNPNFSHDGMTIFIVFQEITQVGAHVALLCKGTANDNRIMFLVDTSPGSRQLMRYWELASGSKNQIGPTTGYMMTYRMALINTNSGMAREEMFMQGAQVASKNAFLPAWDTGNNWAIGANSTGASFFLAGDIAELIIYNRDLSEYERQEVETYLAQKYAIDRQAPPVQNTGRINLTVTGNSLQVGQNSYGSDIYTQLQQTFNYPLTILNLSIPGETTTTMITYPNSRENKFFNAQNLNIMCMWELTNDIYVGGVSAATAYANYKSYLSAVYAGGFRNFIVLTCLPRGSSSPLEAIRIATNTLVTSSLVTDMLALHSDFNIVVLDVGSNATIGLPGSQNNATYFNADLIHLTPAGYAIVVAMLAPVLKTMIDSLIRVSGIDYAINAAGAVTMDMTQLVPTSNTGQTVGDALNAARAQGFGKWTFIGTTLTMYAADGTTVVHTFTLNSSIAPTSRT